MISFQGLPSRICWLKYGDREKAALLFNKLVKEGRVKVKFKWRNNDDEIWARIIVANKGVEPLFEEHDVVLVAFEQGNFEYPFVIGLVYPNLKDIES